MKLRIKREIEEANQLTVFWIENSIAYNVLLNDASALEGLSTLYNFMAIHFKENDNINEAINSSSEGVKFIEICCKKGFNEKYFEKLAAYNYFLSELYSFNNDIPHAISSIKESIQILDTIIDNTSMVHPRIEGHKEAALQLLSSLQRY